MGTLKWKRKVLALKSRHTTSFTLLEPQTYSSVNDWGKSWTTTRATFAFLCIPLSLLEAKCGQRDREYKWEEDEVTSSGWSSVMVSIDLNLLHASLPMLTAFSHHLSPTPWNLPHVPHFTLLLSFTFLSCTLRLLSFYRCSLLPLLHSILLCFTSFLLLCSSPSPLSSVLANIWYHLAGSCSVLFNTAVPLLSHSVTVSQQKPVNISEYETEKLSH